MILEAIWGTIGPTFPRSSKQTLPDIMRTNFANPFPILLLINHRQKHPLLLPLVFSSSLSPLVSQTTITNRNSSPR